MQDSSSKAKFRVWGLHAAAAAAAKSRQSCPDSVQPHRQQPTRPHRPWDSPGKNTGVGCHFLLQCMKVKSESEVTELCLTLHNPMDCSLPGSSIHGIFQARVLEWVAIASSIFKPKSQISFLMATIRMEKLFPICYIPQSTISSLPFPKMPTDLSGLRNSYSELVCGLGIMDNFLLIIVFTCNTHSPIFLLWFFC